MHFCFTTDPMKSIKVYWHQIREVVNGAASAGHLAPFENDLFIHIYYNFA